MYKLMDKATGETVPTGNIVFTMHREAVTLVGCTSPRHGADPGRIRCRDESGTEHEWFPAACGLEFVRVPS